MAVSSPRKLSIENLESRLNLSTVPLTDNPLTRELAAHDAFGLARTRANYVSLFTNNTTTSLTDQTAVGKAHNGNHGVALAAPTKLTASNVGINSVSLAWSDNATNESGYYVMRSNNGATYNIIATLGSGATSYNDSGLVAGTKYFYVVSVFGGGSQVNSNAISVTTQAAAAPAAPTNLAFNGVSTNSLTVTWSDNSKNGTGFRVYRSVDNTNFSLIATLSAGATGYTDGGLAGNTKYYYKIGEYNGNGQANSSSASITTQAASLPNSPSNLAFSNISNASLTLSWSDNSSNETGVRVYRSTDGINFSLVATLAANTKVFNDTGLSPTTTYYYQVGAYNSVGEADSTAASATTLAYVPPSPVNISTKNMTSFTELDIDGTSGNDSILVTQSNGTLIITANGVTTNLANTFGNIVIHGYAGNDTITVDSSVNIAALIYGGDGNDTIINMTTGKATIVTIGNGANTVTGNGINTSFWVNPSDVVNASSTEIANGAVNRVSNWFQPSNGSVPRALAGQNLVDPSDSGSTYRLSNNSFWGTGPSMNDINQGQLADCYYLAPLASLANNETVKFMNTGVDLGDGTYAVRFIRNGVTSFVRVDGDLSSAGYAHPGASGNMWGAIYEKAYAFLRSNASTYSSLNYGYQSAAFSDMGFANTGISPGSGDAGVLSAINNAINSGHALAASSNASIGGGAPIIGSHCYSVIGAYRDASGVVQVQLRNPWGFDGAGNDGNPGDGLVTIPYSMFASSFNALTYTTA